jgi:hypothetical protein
MFSMAKQGWAPPESMISQTRRQGRESLENLGSM